MEEFEKVVLSTVALHNILKNMGIRDHTGAWLDFLHLDIAMNVEQKKARKLMEDIITAIIEQNDQISSGLVYQRIRGVISNAIWFPLDYPDFPSSASEEIKILFEYKAYRVVRIPLTYLKVSDEPVKFGVVTIHNMSDENKNDSWWKFIKSSGGDDWSVQAYADVMSVGDLEKSRINARSIVNDMLIFMRAIGFQITSQIKHEFGMLDEYPSSHNLPYHTGRPTENYQLEAHVESSMTIGPGTFPYDVQKDLLNSIALSKLERLQKLIEDDYFEPSSELKRKFFLGLRWLGDATKPEKAEIQFSKLAFSLEALIGGETEIRENKTTIAKRCAVLIGKDTKEKTLFYNLICSSYDKRSSIVHGDAKRITDQDIAKFGKAVRQTAFALLDKLDTLSNIGDLQKWVDEQPLFFQYQKVENSLLRNKRYEYLGCDRWIE
jgi:hypothetical protein